MSKPEELDLDWSLEELFEQICPVANWSPDFSVSVVFTQETKKETDAHQVRINSGTYFDQAVPFDDASVAFTVVVYGAAEHRIWIPKPTSTEFPHNNPEKRKVLLKSHQYEGTGTLLHAPFDYKIRTNYRMQLMNRGDIFYGRRFNRSTTNINVSGDGWFPWPTSVDATENPTYLVFNPDFTPDAPSEFMPAGLTFADQRGDRKSHPDDHSKWIYHDRREVFHKMEFRFPVTIWRYRP